QDRMQSQGDVHILAGVTCRFLDVEAVETDAVLAFAGDLGKFAWSVLEMMGGHLLLVVPVPSRIEHIRHERHVVVGGEATCSPQKDQEIEFEVLRDLEDAVVFEHWLQLRDEFDLRDLRQAGTAVESKAGDRVVAARNIAGIVRPYCECNATELGLYRIDRR